MKDLKRAQNMEFAPYMAVNEINIGGRARSWGHRPHTRSSLVTLACALKSYRAGEDRTLVAVYDGVFRGDDTLER
ncbi:hypothetical protein PC112_g24885 [Phytophthora cactorum]|uniref:Uncharacterized protein n=1 Tax=Phytophthora cactorum TaxID=29920 RepID=A0A8T1A7K0_9STRA|nr:hypothetical protein PC112_g24885 [Phytophthora cactorum]KAG2871179.1 hypothetical protein PC115_g24913 [Phytophthora cactorum]KAG2874017.1 hypothetical protein PC117_g27690 [Phytophthora cactorum]KAG2962212.1 hypothetical protein PC120_g27711 [Phytophthora cactorum]KAG3120112.1 hypothetical protein C6341_g27364 [Phytophthora cactorum]